MLNVKNAQVCKPACLLTFIREQKTNLGDGWGLDRDLDEP